MARRQGHFGGRILSAFRQAEGRTGRKGPEKVRRRSRKGKVERKLRTLDANLGLSLLQTRRFAPWNGAAPG